MVAVNVLLWILAGIAGVILLTALAVVALLGWVASIGFRAMRDDEASELPGRSKP